MILSHTFLFDTHNSLDTSKTKHNLIAITEEDEKKHFVQYISYRVINDTTISLRYINIKVDRSYYLEIANINISNLNRKRYIFSVLGKRRFGANSKRVDYYLLNKQLNTGILDKEYKEFHESRNYEADYTYKSEYSTNEYRIHSFKLLESTIYFLDQKNTTPRKSLHKTFCVELLNQEVTTLQTLDTQKRKVDYLFNKIGKIHFKDSQATRYKLTKEYKDFSALADSKLLKSSSEMEVSSRVNDNLVFRKLKEILSDTPKLDKHLYSSFVNLLKNPTQEEHLLDYANATDFYLDSIKGIDQLQDISKYFLEIKSLVETQSLAYLLTKKDNDLRDIFLYMLESFNTWTSYLYDDNEDVKAFNVATIDFKDSLRHLIDICFKFKHEYKCDEVEMHSSCPIGNLDTSYNSEEIITSAEKFFNDIELDGEVYDELHELEHDIIHLEYKQEWTDELAQTLINFFEGYTRVLNPLFEFKDLSYSFMLLGQKLKEYIVDENAEILLTLLKYLIADLLEWKRTVLVERTAADIHYMDKSFYSNIAQIEVSMGQRDMVAEEEDMIEFF